MRHRLVIAVLAVLAAAAPVAPAAPATAPPTPPAYAGGPVARGGAIAGIATYAGPETDRQVTVTQDQATCAARVPATRPEGSLVVTAGRVQGVVAWIEGIAAGKAAAPGTLTIDNVDCAFVPRVAVAMTGDTLVTRSSDAVLHSTSLRDVARARSLANLALPPGGAPMTRVLRREGLVAVGCEVHPWMSGWIHVFPHPYAVVSGPDGTFELRDVPPGTWTLKAWHERLGERTTTVTVPPEGRAEVLLDWSAGR